MSNHHKKHKQQQHAANSSDVDINNTSSSNQQKEKVAATTTTTTTTGASAPPQQEVNSSSSTERKSDFDEFYTQHYKKPFQVLLLPQTIKVTHTNQTTKDTDASDKTHREPVVEEIVCDIYNSAVFNFARTIYCSLYNHTLLVLLTILNVLHVNIYVPFIQPLVTASLNSLREHQGENMKLVEGHVNSITNKLSDVIAWCSGLFDKIVLFYVYALAYVIFSIKFAIFAWNTMTINNAVAFAENKVVQFYQYVKTQIIAVIEFVTTKIKEVVNTIKTNVLDIINTVLAKIFFYLPSNAQIKSVGQTLNSVVPPVINNNHYYGIIKSTLVDIVDFLPFTKSKLQ